RRIVRGAVYDRLGDEERAADVVRVDSQRLLVRPEGRVPLALQVERGSQRLPERGRLGEVPRGHVTEGQQLLRIRDQLRRAQRRLEEGAVGPFGGIRRVLPDEAVESAARQTTLDTDAQAEVLHPLVRRVARQPIVEQGLPSLVLMLLPQQLDDAEAQLDVLRLTGELAGQGVDGLERVALLLVDVRDVLPRGGVQRVALRRALIGHELTVERHVLRLVHGRDAHLSGGEVGLDHERLARGVEGLRELALLARLDALAGLLGGLDDVVQTIGDPCAVERANPPSLSRAASMTATLIAESVGVFAIKGSTSSLIAGG